MKHVTNFAGAAIVGLLLYFAAKFGEHSALYSGVSGFGTMLQGVWLSRWDHLALYCICAGAATFVLWYLIGQSLEVDPHAKSTKRPVWILLLVLPAVVAVWGIFTLPPVTQNLWLAQLFLFLDALVSFWLMSAFFSPSRVKFDPLLSEGLRKLRDSSGL